MAKNVEKDGKMRDKLKETTMPDARKLVEAVVGVGSAHQTIKDNIKPGDSITINKSEAEILMREFAGKKKEHTMDADQAIRFAKSRNIRLQEMKGSRKQQNTRLIGQLRARDPLGKKTCGRCGYRVEIVEMDTEKELCEICAS